MLKCPLPKNLVRRILFGARHATVAAMANTNFSSPSNSAFQRRLSALTSGPQGAALRQGLRGIEKESLRVTHDGTLATTPHPRTFGSALTHPNITTDYSESQLELITGVHASVEQCLEELTQVHQFAYRSLGDEMMWVSSMPCLLPADETIPIGHYGASNVARAKSVYRMGLAHRYGRRMQTISGIHYNWSLPGVSDADYAAWLATAKKKFAALDTEIHVAAK